MNTTTVVTRKASKRTRAGTRIPRALTRRIPKGYTGEVRFTRTASKTLSIADAAGFTVGAGNYDAIAMVFDPTGATIFGSAVNFTTAPLPNAAEIAALWDRLEIVKVEITIDPLCDKSTSGATTATPRMLICNDPNDGSAGTSVDAIRQHSDCKALYGNGPHKWTVYPNHLRLVYYTPLTSSYEPAKGFVNSDTAIPHYGTHLGVINVGSISATSVIFNFKFFLRCKNVK